MVAAALPPTGPTPVAVGASVVNEDATPPLACLQSLLACSHFSQVRADCYYNVCIKVCVLNYMS